MDLLIHPNVQQRLGPDLIADAVFKALHDSRMGVLPHHLERIVGLIDDERTARCPSLAAASSRVAAVERDSCHFKEPRRSN